LTKKSTIARRWEKLRETPSKIRADLTHVSTPVATSDKSPSNRAKKWARSTERAFEQTKLDPNNDAHWTILLSVLARAMCGGKGRGQPKRWNKKKLRRLREDVAQIKAENPDATELECCEILLKRKDLPRRYQDISEATTLLRVLQKAKASDRDKSSKQRPDLQVEHILVKRIDEALRSLAG
jgi:hypothetical protein